LELLSEAFREAADAAEVHCFTSCNLLLQQLYLIEKNDLPDMIVLDHYMPLMDGGDVVKAIQSQRRFNDISLVVYSTSLQEKL
jgi:CheY-like chemotaxis protein